MMAIGKGERNLPGFVGKRVGGWPVILTGHRPKAMEMLIRRHTGRRVRNAGYS